MTTPTQEGGTQSVIERLEAHLSQDEQEETEEVEQADDSATDGADEESEGEDAPEATPENDASEDTQEVDVSVIAAALGFDENDVSVDDDGNLLVRVKVDGEETWAKPADIRKGYQLEGHANKKSMEASEQQKQLAAQQEKLTQEHQASLKQAESIITLAAQELQGDYAKVNWDQLRLDDPQEWSAKQLEFQQRTQRLRGAWQGLEQERSKLTEQQQAQQSEYLKGEQQKLKAAIPEWSDDTKFDAGKREIGAYLKSIGFADDQIKTVSDHRAIVMARKAMLYDQLQSKKPEITKKVAKAPKLVKSGQARTKAERSSEELSKARKGLASGKRGSVADFLLQAGKV